MNCIELQKKIIVFYVLRCGYSFLLPSHRLLKRLYLCILRFAKCFLAFSYIYVKICYAAVIRLQAACKDITNYS